MADAKVGDGDPLAAISDECNFNEYDELIVSTLPLKISKWLHLDLPRKAEAATGLPVTHVSRERGLVELEEREGVDPVIERRCAECGVELTDAEIQAALETRRPVPLHGARERGGRPRRGRGGAWLAEVEDALEASPPARSRWRVGEIGAALDLIG